MPATCKKFVCSPDNCNAPSWTDELSGAPAQEEEVKLTASTDLKNPVAPYIKVGTVTFKVEWILNAPVKATIQSASCNPEIVLTKPIPQSVIDEAKEWMRGDGDCQSWLESVSTQDAIFKYLETDRTQDIIDVVDASVAYRLLGYINAGDKVGQPVKETTVTIDYYTTGKFEGCEVGTSDSYGKDDYKCGYGSFTIDNNLHLARPDHISAFNFPAWNPPWRNLEPLVLETVELLEPAAASLASQANSYLNNTYVCRDIWNCWANVQGSASIGNSNGFLANGNSQYLMGNGYLNFYGQVNFADPSAGSNALAIQASPMFFDPSIFDGQVEPYDPLYWGVAWNITLQSNLQQIAQQNLQLFDVPNQALSRLQQLFNGTKNRTQTHVETQYDLIEVIVEGFNGQGVAEGKAQQNGVLKTEGAGKVEMSVDLLQLGTGGFGGGGGIP